MLNNGNNGMPPRIADSRLSSLFNKSSNILAYSTSLLLNFLKFYNMADWVIQPL